MHHVQDAGEAVTLPIQCDTRELRSGIPSALAERYPTITLEMEVGDYGMVDTISQCILTERKEVSDLLSSIADGRLKSQITRIQAADVAFLLIEGELKNHDGDTDYCIRVTGTKPHAQMHLYRHSGYDYPYVLSLILRTLYLSPIRVLWSQDKAGSIALLSALYRATLRGPIRLDGSIDYTEGDDT